MFWKGAFVMDDSIETAQIATYSFTELIKKYWRQLVAFLKRNKEAIGAATAAALILDIITGVIFGFGGAALFAAI